MHDSLWNAPNILAKYGREHRAGDDAFNDVLLKADLFVAQMRPFAKSRNRRGSIGWWNSDQGRQKDHARMAHLIAIPPTAQIFQCDDVVKRGGYATIRKVRIEGAVGIERHWDLAVKLSNNWQCRPDLAKLEHQNESMAVTIPHPGVIRFVAIHPHKYEGYAYWWNGGTLREMLNRDCKFGDEPFIRLNRGNYSDDEVNRVHQLIRFRRKRTELVWALLYIMNEVHKSHNLHNDLSPDNILFHFPDDESKVYIGICNWGLASKDFEERQSPYTFTNAKHMAETLQRRWWVDPTIAYLHRPNADVHIIPPLTRASEEFATARIAQRICANSMSPDYQMLQQTYRDHALTSTADLATIFHLYLNRVCSSDRDRAGGLSHIVTFFCNTWNWPMPSEHFRTTYY